MRGIEAHIAWSGVGLTSSWIVWQYGHFNAPGNGPDQLSKPDGLALLP